MTDPFASFGAKHARKARPAGKPKPAQQNAMHKALAEDRELSKQYRAAQRRWRDDTIASLGRHRMAVQSLLQWVEKRGPEDADKVVAAIAKRPWLATLTVDQRRLILRTVDELALRVRKELGLPPFDDPIPWNHEATEIAFFRTKELLRL